MIITPDMEKYILLQRTGYGDANVLKCYTEDIQKDYQSIKEYLPEKCNRILDIGCGLAGIDLLLYNHYKGDTELHLFDYNKTDDKIHYGYHKTASVYNSLDLSGAFLKNNGVEKKKIGLHDASFMFPVRQYDIIISLLSLGFHYPVDTYLSEMIMCKPKIIILDLRKHSEQLRHLLSYFDVKIIAEYSKVQRVLLT